MHQTVRYLQRVVNAGGHIEREYGIGRRRTDLLSGMGTGRREAEIGGRVQVAARSAAAYGVEGSGTDESHPVIFDRSEKRIWKEKTFRREETVGAGRVTIWTM